jgi:hypothetical protein
MNSPLMPRLELLPGEVPIAVWADESDARWVVAVFLNGDLGVSLMSIDDVVAGLDSLIEKQIANWTWSANGCMIHATPESCRLELMDSDLPPDFPVVVIPPSGLKEIVLAWKQFVLTHPGPNGPRPTPCEDCRSSLVEGRG